MSREGGSILVLGAITAAVGVAVGAFGAHALEARVAADMMVNFETGARYHFYHALGIIAIGVVALQCEGANATLRRSRLRRAASLMLAGIVLFSGSLYAMALTGQRWLGAVTPFGGGAFIAAWVLFAWAVSRRE